MTSQPSGGALCCHVGGEQFAFRGSDVRLIARAEQMLPDAGRDGRLGVLQQAGADVPVYALGTLLGQPAPAARDVSHVVVTDGARGAFGVLVDRAVRVALDDGAAVLPLPAFVGPPAGRWFAGLLHDSRLTCLLLSPLGLQSAGAQLGGPPDEPRPTAAAARGTEAGEIVVLFRTPALPSCDADRYAIGARRIGGVVQTLPSVPLPGAPRFVTGLSWWQGTAVPLLDFGAAGRRTSRSRYLLLRTRGGTYAGLPVEADVALRRATAEDRQVRGGGDSFVKGLFSVGGERVALIDVDALVAADSHASIASYAG